MGVAVAKEVDAIILSLDSLAIYKQINIASAKPSQDERGGVVHFGIDVIYPDEAFNVTLFIKLYNEAAAYAKKQNKDLIILGGTGFYLNALLEGVSQFPFISQKAKDKTVQLLADKEAAYKQLLELAPHTKIAKNDSYRMQKWFEIYFETGTGKEEYFQKHPPEPVIKQTIPIYEIEVERDKLRQRIDLRTEKMFANGIIEEVKGLLQTYGNTPQCFKAIGIKEVIAYLENACSYEEAKELVATHTKQLAKRQRTYNRSKFPHKISLPLEQMQQALLKEFGVDDKTAKA